jgi:hypothetical protein
MGTASCTILRINRSTEWRDYLTGHVDGSAGAVYVHDVSVEAMANAIEKIAFDL